VPHMDVIKVDWDVAYIAFVASVSDECHKRFFFKMFHLFQTYVCKCFDLDVAYISHICCKSVSQMFHLFLSYIVASVFMFQVVSVYQKVHMLQWLYMYVASICFKYFRYFKSMLQVFYLDIAYVVVAIHICCKHMFPNISPV
jgi:hypothetical protein